MTRTLCAALTVAFALQLAGCATPAQPLHDPGPSRSEQNDTAQLIRYANQLKGRNAAELAAELEALNRAYAQRHTENNRLRLAIYHAVANTRQADRARAIALLDLPPGDANGRGRNHPIAQILLPSLLELRRQDDALVVTQQSLSSTQQRLRDEQKRSESLQQKLDAIRDIEKKMLDRPSANTQ